MNKLISFFSSILLSAVLWYLFLVPLTPLSFSFWLWVSFSLGIYSVIDYFLSSGKNKSGMIVSGITGLIFIIVIFVAFLGSKPMNAKDYATVIPKIEEKSFGEFPEGDLNKLALLDRDSATRIGNSYLGNIDKVSQFEISDEYRQITIKDQPYRVSPLKYSSFFRWVNNRKEGIEYYVKVNQTTGKAELVKLDKGMRFSLSSYFFDDVKVKLRFEYPTKIFGDPSFEVDDNGVPYYVATVYKPAVFLSSYDASSVILMNAITGESKEYSLKDTPEWVDRVYSAENIISRVDDYYYFNKGFWNTVFGKVGLKTTTNEYNYLSIGKDIYLYTGLTSVNADNSNLGFVLSNMRTRETTFYKLPSATESAAMSSAQGEVQEKGYSATAPILVKLSGKGYYLVSLKDSAGLVKSYALVNAEDYQEVTVNSDIQTLISQFTTKDVSNLSGETDEEESDNENTVKIKGVIEDIKTQIIKGTTVYYIKIAGTIYKVEANEKTLDELPFLQVGTEVSGNLSDNNFLKQFEIVK